MPNRNNKNATIGVRYIFPLSKVQPTEITSVSILRNPDENCRHFRANIRKENLRCTWEELQDEKKEETREKRGREKDTGSCACSEIAFVSGVVRKIGGNIVENLATVLVAQGRHVLYPEFPWRVRAYTRLHRHRMPPGSGRSKHLIFARSREK